MKFDYLLGEKLDLAVLHLETLLDESGQLANALGLLTKNVLGAGGQDDDLGTLGGDADLDTGVAILGQFLDSVRKPFKPKNHQIKSTHTAKETVQLGLEDALSDMLSLLGDVG